jgi:hypothetical protein
MNNGEGKLSGLNSPAKVGWKGILWPLVAAVVLLAALLAPSMALAQEGGPPGLPVIYSGEVYVDGQLLAEESQLTARVGDWESQPVAVRDGKFELLVAGPPSVAYVGRDVTFHLRDMVASQQFIFPLLTQPTVETLRLDFSLPASQPAASPEEAVVVPVTTSVEAPAGDEGPDIPWATLAGLLVGGSVLVVVLNWAARRWLRDGR